MFTLGTMATTIVFAEERNVKKVGKHSSEFWS